jgi:hypothetical protein
VISLYLNRTTQHRNTKTNIHASSEIRAHDPSKKAAKTYALDCAATGTSLKEQATTSYIKCGVRLMRNVEVAAYNPLSFTNKIKGRFMRSPVCLAVCPPLITFETSGGSRDFIVYFNSQTK